jgi:hypothetical protein
VAGLKIDREEHVLRVPLARPERQNTVMGDMKSGLTTILYAFLCYYHQRKSES